MKKVLFAAVLLLTCASFVWGASASDRKDIRRAAGYRGSVSFTNQYLVWLGFDTSHGWMFDEHHYLGGGAGFATVMMAVGVLGDQNPFEDFGKSVFEMEPNVGWSWAFDEDMGMRLSLGATIIVYKGWSASVMPKLSVGFEF